MKFRADAKTGVWDVITHATGEALGASYLRKQLCTEGPEVLVRPQVEQGSAAWPLSKSSQLPPGMQK